MKRIIIPALLMCTTSCLLQAQVNYLLKGRVGNLNAPDKIYLAYMLDGKVVRDSVIPQNGRFSFAGKLPGPTDALLHLVAHSSSGIMDNLTIILEKGTIHLNSPDSLKNAVITGSKLNDDYKKLQAILQPGKDKITNLQKDYNSLTRKQIEDTAIRAAMEERMNAINEEKKMLCKKFIADHPDSYISQLAIQEAVGAISGYDDLKLLCDGLSANLQKSAMGKELAKKMAFLKHTSIGAMAPDFTQNDTSGLPVKLSSFRGRYVLLDFWASWCGPCRAENPNVLKNFLRYKDKNFTVLSVSLDNDKDKWLKAIHDDKLPWTQVSDLAGYKSTVVQLYPISGIPTNFLIDPSGKIVGVNLAEEALGKKLSELLD